MKRKGTLSGKTREAGRKNWKRLGFAVPAAACLLLLFYLLPSIFSGDPHVRVLSGLEFRMPDGFSQRYSDSRYAVWEYTGKERKAGSLILDADIRDGKARNFSTVEAVLSECDWLRDAEIYVNPQGVRMVRGFAEYTGSTERRYYIESAGSVLLMSMHEDERYYSPEDCETLMLAVAEGVRRVK
ncbi:MAG: hypothetical protein IKQ41_06545 [Clostridia bacterium]|nr:hypothetical protein [Clostridia bacterium]